MDERLFISHVTTPIKYKTIDPTVDPTHLTRSPSHTLATSALSPSGESVGMQRWEEEGIRNKLQSRVPFPDPSAAGPPCLPCSWHCWVMLPLPLSWFCWATLLRSQCSGAFTFPLQSHHLKADGLGGTGLLWPLVEGAHLPTALLLPGGVLLVTWQHSRQRNVHTQCPACSLCCR